MKRLQQLALLCASKQPFSRESVQSKQRRFSLLILGVDTTGGSWRGCAF